MHLEREREREGLVCGRVTGQRGLRDMMYLWLVISRHALWEGLGDIWGICGAPRATPSCTTGFASNFRCLPVSSTPMAGGVLAHWLHGEPVPLGLETATLLPFIPLVGIIQDTTHLILVFYSKPFYFSCVYPAGLSLDYLNISSFMHVYVRCLCHIMFASVYFSSLCLISSICLINWL